MVNLGNKFNKSTKLLGHKIERGSRRLGHKIVSLAGKSDGAMRKIDNSLKEVNSNGGRLIPGVGQAIGVAGFASHMVRKGTSTARRHELEKYNRRKAKQDEATENAGGAFI